MMDHVIGIVDVVNIVGCVVIEYSRAEDAGEDGRIDDDGVDCGRWFG